ncbi:DUF5906 domain-containing protein [Vogesella sp. GCM10023246]|uniref:DUF5906 domain-containing protein n=1 Tax=Vogesella oryzagri TaxID=3160864 RepID=A0ABV1M4F2_9NEIS
MSADRVSRRVNIARVASVALGQIENLVPNWLRDGKREGCEWSAPNPTRADRHAGSFKVNLNTGAWSDFALGDSGGDLVSLYRYVFFMPTQVEAAKELGELLMMPDYELYSDQPVVDTKPAASKSPWVPVLPVPADAPAMHKAHTVRGMPQRVAVYRDGAGALLGAVMRFVTSDGGKDDIPHTFCRHSETGAQEWRWMGFPEPRPLYGLDALSAKPDAVVLLPEGEKCKDVAAALLGDFAVLSWPGGGKAVKKVDWSPLAGRKVVIWPDADSQRKPVSKTEKEAGVDPTSKPLLDADDQPGMKAALWIAPTLAALGCEVSVIELPAPGTLADGWDIADAVQKDGWDAEQVLAFIGEHAKPFGVAVSEPATAAEAPAAVVTADAPAEGGQSPAAVSAPSGDDMAAAVLPLLKRFALVHGKKRVFDTQVNDDMPWTAFVAVLKNNRKLAEAWLEHPDSRVMMQQDVSRLKRDADDASRLNDEDFSDALCRYVYLDGSENIWDAKLRKIISYGAVKLSMGDSYKLWLNSPARRVIDARNLVFDPTQRADPATHINQFCGLPLTPVYPGGEVPRVDSISDLVPLFPACENIINLTMHLCDYRPDVWQWLINWLAFPLQHVGAKMATSVLMHSDVHGSGKSLFFEEVIKPLYGEYGATIGQDQLDGNFSGWRSQKLFGLFEEVTGSTERYSQTGKLKHLITGKTQVIERKFVDAWEESNHLNPVFLSNAAMPFHVEASDRRMTVIWPSNKLDEALQAAVEGELADGGVLAFYGFLMSVPLVMESGDRRLPFTPHTKPVQTPERDRLIALGLAAWEGFLVDWEKGFLGVPYGACLAYQLYGLYHDWSLRGREKTILPYRKFGQLVESRIGFRVVKHYRYGTVQAQSTLFMPVRCPHGEVEQDWLGRQVQEFMLAAREADWDVEGWDVYKPAPVRRSVKDGNGDVKAA